MFKWDEIKRDASGSVVLLYRHQRIIDEGVIQPTCKVLDVGGWGVLAQALIQVGASCTILDNFSEDQYFPDRVRGLPHVNGDILDKNTLKALGKCDVVTCLEMVEHCEDQPGAIHNMFEVLNSSGVLVGTFPLPGHSHKEDDPTVTFLDITELGNLLTSAGFVVDVLEPTPSIAL